MDMMTPAELMCTRGLMTGCELVFLVGAVWVWRALVRMRVNGACQLGLGLLVVVRAAAAVGMAGDATASPLDWAWLTEVLFSFVFLYTLYHMGVLISMCRR